jgi:hypothetical protein
MENKIPWFQTTKQWLFPLSTGKWYWHPIVVSTNDTGFANAGIPLDG